MKTEQFDLRNQDNMKLMSEFEDNHFDLAIVDPPYGIGIDKAMNANKGKQGFKQYKVSDWDSEIPKKEYFKQLFRVSKNQIIWGGNYFTEFLKPSMCWLVWNKVQRDFTMSDGELAWSSFDKTLRMFDCSRGKAMGNNNKNGGKNHPTQKPVSLYEWILKNYSEEGQKILDTHLGSGSIALAVHNMNSIEKMNLTLTGCELDSDYFEAMTTRINKHTQQKTIFDL